MHNLSPITALGGITAQIDKFDGLTIAENPDIALASLALRNGKKSAFTRAMKAAVGCGAPAPGHFDGDGTLLVFASGLDQWMVQAPISAHEDLAVMLGGSFKDTASITEQNDGWVRFDVTGDITGDAIRGVTGDVTGDISGKLAVSLFERLCAVNAAAMTPGMVTRTAIEHLGCFVMCHKAGRHFGVIGPRSSAASLHHALITAAKSLL